MIIIPAYTPIYLSDGPRLSYLIENCDMRVYVLRIEGMIRRKVYFRIENTEYWVYADNVRFIN